MTGQAAMAKGERLGRFREFVEIVHRLLIGETVTCEGGYYPVTGAVLAPRPIQQPRPPLTIAAEGPLALRVVADHADRWVSYGLHARSGISDLAAMMAHMRERNALLDELCAERGRDPRSIRRCLLVGLTARTCPLVDWRIRGDGRPLPGSGGGTSSSSTGCRMSWPTKGSTGTNTTAWRAAQCWSKLP